MHDLISVVVFMRNSAKTIDRALASVIMQNAPFELLVFDGGSTDGTVDIVRRYESYITYWRSFPDGNGSNAINEGVERATGNIICLLAGDDWLEPGAFKDIRDTFALIPDLEMLSCGVRLVQVKSDDSMRDFARYKSESVLAFTMDNLTRHPLTCGRFILRDIYLELGGHNPDCPYADLDFLIRLKLRGVKTAVLPKICYSYERHIDSRTVGDNPPFIMEMMRGEISISEHFLTRSFHSLVDKEALVGLHVRASARLAWMLAVRMQLVEAAQVIFAAFRQNWKFPYDVVYWLIRAKIQDRGVKQ
jgi:glycosyltransferase involved in cell wall biosynthesis